MVAKSFPRKQVYRKIIFENNFLSKIFYDCKIISWKTGLKEKYFWEKFFGRNFLMVAKSFPRKQVYRKIIFEKNVLSKTFYDCKIIVLSKTFYDCKIISWKTGLQEKHFWEKLLGRNFFMIAKSFPRKQVYRKIIFEKKFLSKIFYDCKIISWKTGLQE